MPKIYLSDKQLPPIPSDATIVELVEMTKRATPGKRLIVNVNHGKLAEPPKYHIVTEQLQGPLGPADAELAATLHPELVRGLLYKIALLEDARNEACNLLQDALGKDISPQKAAKLKKLMEAGNAT